MQGINVTPVPEESEDMFQFPEIHAPSVVLTAPYNTPVWDISVPQCRQNPYTGTIADSDERQFTCRACWMERLKTFGERGMPHGVYTENGVKMVWRDGDIGPVGMPGELGGPLGPSG